VYLQSVLPNSVDWEIRIFAKEYFRLLKPGGILFLTTFIEENVPDMTENPEGYIMKCTYPRQIVRFEKNYFLKMFTDVGFVVDTYEQGTEVDFQSAVYFKKPL
jgi:predicted SAM-dependent methyltransferase